MRVLRDWQLDAAFHTVQWQSLFPELLFSILQLETLVGGPPRSASILVIEFVPLYPFFGLG